MGRPIEITQDVKDAVIGATEADPEITLRELESLFDIYTVSIRTILNDDSNSFSDRKA